MIFLENDDAGSPFWKLVLKQFDDLLVKILIAAAIISFILAKMNGETGLSAIIEPSVSPSIFIINDNSHYVKFGLELLVYWCWIILGLMIAYQNHSFIEQTEVRCLD
jgi:preprotein translocase subunit SecG